MVYFMKNWLDIYAQAKEKATKCRCCPECNGKACRGETPGCGGKGSGSTFVRNYDKLREVFITLDTISGNEDIDTSATLFGRRYSLPVYAAPIGGILTNYGADMSEDDYARELVIGSTNAGSVAFTGDGVDPNMFLDPLKTIKEVNGNGIPTIKPWNDENVAWRMEASIESGAFAIASDIDASGLTNLRNLKAPVEFKDVEGLKKMKEHAKVPFIVKGIMSVEGAMKALEAGADAIVVSNHGGRVLDECLSSIEVLEDIAKAVNKRMTVLVDSGFRSGSDVFKALALGADGVLIGRPLSLAVIGGGREGVEIYFNKIKAELMETMSLSGCKTLKDITREKVTVKF